LEERKIQNKTNQFIALLEGRSQPNIIPSSIVSLMIAARCMSFFGMQPTLTHLHDNSNNNKKNSRKRKEMKELIHNLKATKNSRTFLQGPK
jgi:L-lactate permease